jgi:hypothetical protein
MSPDTPSSLASQLLQGDWVVRKCQVHHKNCGSWLAGDEAGTSNINVAWYAVIAGKPAPTRGLGCPQMPGSQQKLWELACWR